MYHVKHLRNDSVRFTRCYINGLLLLQKSVSHHCCPPKLWPSQNTKSWHPLRPIMSSRGYITYGMAKELANIIHPLLGQSPHHLKNTQHFVQHIQVVKLKTGEVMTSYDVKALFMSVLWTLLQTLLNRN